MLGSQCDFGLHKEDVDQDAKRLWLALASIERIMGVRMLTWPLSLRVWLRTFSAGCVSRLALNET